MNNKKANGYVKLLVFFVLLLTLIFTVSLVADGWQDSGDVQNSDNGVILQPTDDNIVADNTPANKEEGHPSENPLVYYNRLTGKVSTDILSQKRHGAFIFNPSSPLYGIGAADIIIEVPIEESETRFAALINDYSSLGKIGSIDKGRNYISSLTESFGAFLISYGYDGRKDSREEAVKDLLDLTTTKGYHYTEYGNLVYTNGNLISGGIASSGLGTVSEEVALPYSFAPLDSSPVRGYTQSSSVSIPISDKLSTDLIYSPTDGKYCLSKNGIAKMDFLTNQALSFDNCFILYMDTVTYDTREGSELTMDTKSGGFGYYLTGGYVIDITWKVNEGGRLQFLGSDGAILMVNRGSSYIASVKSSKIGSTVFS